MHFALLDEHELSGVRGKCYILNVECLPQTHVLKTWSPASDAILGGDGSFRKGGVAGWIK
jgi:hypothetical protein